MNKILIILTVTLLPLIGYCNKPCLDLLSNQIQELATKDNITATSVSLINLPSNNIKNIFIGKTFKNNDAFTKKTVYFK